MFFSDFSYKGNILAEQSDFIPDLDPSIKSSPQLLMNHISKVFQGNYYKKSILGVILKNNII